MVIDMMKIHPAMTLLGGVGNSLSNSVRMPDEMSIALHSYVTNNGQLDIEPYYRKVQKIKKSHAA